MACLAFKRFGTGGILTLQDRLCMQTEAGCLASAASIPAPFHRGNFFLPGARPTHSGYTARQGEVSTHGGPLDGSLAWIVPALPTTSFLYNRASDGDRTGISANKPCRRTACVRRNRHKIRPAPALTHARSPAPFTWRTPLIGGSDAGCGTAPHPADRPRDC